MHSPRTSRRIRRASRRAVTYVFNIFGDGCLALYHVDKLDKISILVYTFLTLHFAAFAKSGFVCTAPTTRLLPTNSINHQHRTPAPSLLSPGVFPKSVDRAWGWAPACRAAYNCPTARAWAEIAKSPLCRRKRLGQPRARRGRRGQIKTPFGAIAPPSAHPGPTAIRANVIPDPSRHTWADRRSKLELPGPCPYSAAWDPSPGGVQGVTGK